MSEAEADDGGPWRSICQGKPNTKVAGPEGLAGWLCVWLRPDFWEGKERDRRIQLSNNL
jgi:hypothetical protein